MKNAIYKMLWNNKNIVIIVIKQLESSLTLADILYFLW